MPGGQFFPNITFYLTTHSVSLMFLSILKHSAVHFSVSMQTRVYFQMNLIPERL